MRAFYSDVFVLPLPSGHRFPMAKYERLRRRAVAEGVLAPGDLAVPEAADDDALLAAHDRVWVEKVKAGDLERLEARRIGFPWSPELVERSRRSAGGTVAACRAALEDGTAVNLAGGTHHAFADRGEGFCVFNDAAIAARAMQAEGRAERVLIVDTDVHQGNGTAAIFRHDPTVFTLSIHGAANFPFRKETSDLDLPLPDGTGDDEYLSRLEDGLDVALAWARREGARLAVWVSGADPYAGDKLGRLALSKKGLARRDERVLERLRDADLPVAVVMAGGYAPEVDDIVDIHLATVDAARLFAG